MQGNTRIAGRGPAPHASRDRIEALIPTDKKLRESLRGQWNNPSRSMNRVPMRLVESNGKQYFVIGWNGGTTISVMHEGKVGNISLTTLARRKVQIDKGWDGQVTLGEVSQGKNIPLPVLSEAEVVKGKTSWMVVKGFNRKLDESTGEVTKTETWDAFQNIDDAPITAVPVMRVQAESREEAVQIVQEAEAKGTSAQKSNPHANYSSRRGGIQTLNEMLGL